MTKARKLRELMARPGPVVIIGAHDGLSGKIGEEAGFDGLWASGFEISASYAVPDANILTMAENLHSAQMMNNVTKVPVVADCDNGYGNAINVIRCVEEYERAEGKLLALEKLQVSLPIGDQPAWIPDLDLLCEELAPLGIYRA